MSRHIDDDDATPIFNPLPTAMLVGVAEDLAQACSKAFDPFKTLRVAHGAAALQRMLSTHPLVVVVGASVSEKEAHDIEQQAGAFGGRVLHERDLVYESLESQLKAAASASMRTRTRM